MNEKINPELKHEIKKSVCNVISLQNLIYDFENNTELLDVMNQCPNLVEIWNRLINTSYRTDSNILQNLESFRFRYVEEGKGDKALWETMTFTEIDGVLFCRSKKYPNTQMAYRKGRVECIAGSAEGKFPLNEFLMSPRIPNCNYIVDDVFDFRTDAQGRTVSINGTINAQDIKRIDRYRNPIVQSMAIETAGDVGGHGIAYSLGGPSELINLSSMKASLNNREYKAIENTILKAIGDGKTVTVAITNIYKNGMLRPSKYIYEYTINGKKFTNSLSND